MADNEDSSRPHKPRKAFHLAASQIRDVARGYGACVASDRITVDGARVGYCYREPPEFAEDGGWRFLAGDESQDYTDRTENFGLYDVNTVANYDPDVIPLLDAPLGSAFERDGERGFVVIRGWRPEDG